MGFIPLTTRKNYSHKNHVMGFGMRSDTSK